MGLGRSMVRLRAIGTDATAGAASAVGGVARSEAADRRLDPLVGASVGFVAGEASAAPVGLDAPVRLFSGGVRTTFSPGGAAAGSAVPGLVVDVDGARRFLDRSTIVEIEAIAASLVGSLTSSSADRLAVVRSVVDDAGVDRTHIAPP